MASSTFMSSTATTHFSPLTLSSHNKLSSSSSMLQFKPSPLHLSSYQSISNLPLQFHAKQPSSSPPLRPFTVISMAPPKPGGKPKKVTGVIKLALEAGKATPSPPVDPALGSKGVNIMAFCKDYDARTADKAGYVIPVEITVYDYHTLPDR